ncbi:MAG: hypothetical protein VZR00_07225 [Lachnospiraceae bacterium]|jgi:hypothetical protein|nr:hypothetical protein [Lachnospiraceae bacterium]MEE3461660.1 hypothetical protein [Lachnospiraceae bacterium]
MKNLFSALAIIGIICCMFGTYWGKLFEKKPVPDGPGNYYIKLNPKGALRGECYGAGKLVD